MSDTATGKALVHQRRKQLLLVTYSKSVVGAWIAGPFDVLAADCTDAEPGATKFDVAHPLRDEWKALTAPFLTARAREVGPHS